MTITEDKRKELADKVKKLLALASSANEHESKLAAEKVKDLLERYNMTLTDVEILSAEMTNHGFQIPRFSVGHKNQFVKKLDPWHEALLSFVKKFYFVDTIIVTDPDMVKIHILGAKQDVEVATYIFSFLHNRIYFLADEAIAPYRIRMNSGQQRKWRTDFAMGVISSLQSRYYQKQQSESVAKSSSGTDLVSVKGAAVKEFSNKQFPRITYKKGSERNMDYDAYIKGTEAAKDIHIRHGVHGGEGQKALR